MTPKKSILIPVARTLDGCEHPLPCLDEDVCPGSDRAEPGFFSGTSGHACLPCEEGTPLLADEPVRSASRWRLLGTLLALLLFLGFAAAWKWTRLSELLDIDVVLGWTRWVGESRLAPVYVLLIYVLSGLVAFPVSILIVATALTFGAVAAFVYSMLGSLASAATLFMLGHVLGQQTVRRFAGTRLNKLNDRLARQGLLTVIALRVFPVGPYTLVNFVAGASEIGFRDYMLGTLLGMTPALVAVTLFGDRLGDVLRHPTLDNVLLLVAITVLFLGVNVLIRRLMLKRESQSAARDSDPPATPRAGTGARGSRPSPTVGDRNPGDANGG